MSKRRASIELSLALVLLPSSVHAGAWTMEEGTGQLVVSTTASTATRAFDGSSLVSTPRYGKFEAQGLVEYGVTDRLTAIVLPGLQHVDIAPPVDAQRSGLGYFEFGGRYRLLQAGTLVLSGQATVRAPGTIDNSNPAAIGYTDMETDLRALLGYSFDLGAMPAFIDLQLAQRFRAGAPPDEFRADLTFGLRVAPQWMLLAQSFNVMSEGTGSRPFTSYEYYKLQISAVYALTPKITLQLGGVTTYAGRNALQENGIVFGAGYRF
jgi:hypothetical protein